MRRAEQDRARHVRLKQQGLCVEGCGRPGRIADGTQRSRCTLCHEKKARHTRERMAAKATRNECQHCSAQAVQGITKCRMHVIDGVVRSLEYKHKSYIAETRTASVAVLQKLWEDQEGRCAITGQPLSFGQNVSLDHDIPLSRGGSSALENLQWVDQRVNNAKGTMTTEEFKAWIKQVYTLIYPGTLGTEC